MQLLNNAAVYVTQARQQAAESKRAASGKLPPRLASNRRDRNSGRNQQQQSAAAEDEGPAVAGEILPKIENWDNEMANNIPTNANQSEPSPPKSWFHSLFYLLGCLTC